MHMYFSLLIFILSLLTCKCGKVEEHNKLQQICEFKLETKIKDEKTKKDNELLDPANFYQSCLEIGVEYFTGVPDSLLKDFCAYVTDNVPKDRHLIAANEGNAVALATGYHLATGKHALVYLQNSGLGNTINPLASLTSQQVYSIPILLLIGWRGEPGVHDEPQHICQGDITTQLLDSLAVPYGVLPRNQDDMKEVLRKANSYLTKSSAPYALLVRKQTFSPYKLPDTDKHKFSLRREEAVKVIVDSLGPSDVIVCSTGMASRELFEYREEKNQGHERDFLTVGSMGHASTIALGIALQKPDRQVFCLDGDGAAILHMGSMATIGQNALPNFKHVIINNGSHDSVGGQPTDARNHEGFSFVKIAEGCGYKQAIVVETASELSTSVSSIREEKGPILLEVKVNKGHRSDLGRPTRTPIQNKTDFMSYLASR